MKGGLHRPSNAPKPPVVCHVVPVPVVGGIIWVIIIGDTIKPFPGPPFHWDWNADVKTNYPALPPGAIVQTVFVTDVANVVHLIANGVQTNITVPVGSPGSLIDIRMTEPFNPASPEYHWYVRTPRQPTF